MALVFDSRYYLQTNPDVAAAISRGAFASAEEHFNLFGRFESRDPNAFFDTSFYLSEYPDVAAAGVNPFAHFLAFGALEDRFTNDTAASLLDTDGNGFANEFDADAYLEANPDVAAAGVDAYSHFVRFGQFEGRTAILTNGQTITGPLTNTGTAPGTGTTFTLTEGVDTFVGTSANDTFQGDVANLNAFDSINGAGGSNTLNLYGDLGATARPGLSIQNIQTVNLFENASAVNAATFGTAAQQIWQVETAGAITGLTSSQTAGFRGGEEAFNTSATFANGVTTGNIALDNVANDSDVTVAGRNLNTVNVTASINAETVVSDGDPATYDAGLVINIENAAEGASDVTTLNLNLAQNTDLRLEGAEALTTFNAAGSTGGIAINLEAAEELAITSATFGSGNDIVVASQASFTADNVTMNLGAGADRLTVTLGLGAEPAANAELANLILTGGAGADRFEFTGGNIILDEDAFADAMGTVSITDFGTGADTIALEGFVSTTASFVSENAVTQALEALGTGASLYETVEAVAGVVASGTNPLALYAQFQFEGRNYVYGDNGDARGFSDGDLLIDLGSATLTTANVVGIEGSGIQFGF